MTDNDLTLIAEALAVPMARVVHWAKSQLPPMAEAELTDSLISLGMTP
jgi:hypothetical protein